MKQIKVVFAEYISPVDYILSDILPEVNGMILPAGEIHKQLEAAGFVRSLNRTERALFDAVKTRKIERFRLLLPGTSTSVYHYRRVRM